MHDHFTFERYHNILGLVYTEYGLTVRVCVCVYVCVCLCVCVVHRCCGDVAHEIAAKERKQTLHDEEGETSGSDHEVKDLKRMEVHRLE